MKDWLQIVRLYEKDNVYLAEIAQLYIRNIKYEIPNIRKHGIKLEQQLQELSENCENLKRPESQYLSERSVLLQQLGIKGEKDTDIKVELFEAINILPQLYEQIVNKLEKLKSAHKMYSSTVNCNVPKVAVCLPIMQHLLEFGNTTVYEYIHKESPRIVEEPTINLASAGNQEQQQSLEELSIDFGDEANIPDKTEEVNMDVIDYGDDIVYSNVDTSGITTTTVVPEDKVEINFDIPLDEYGIVVERVNVNGSIAKGDQAFTLLDSPIYREKFLDELYELESFVRLSLYQCSSGNNHGTDSILDNNFIFALSSDGMSDQLYDAASLENMLSAIGTVLQSMNEEQLLHLHQIKHSTKYADLLMGKLQQMLRRVEKIRANRVLLKQQMETLKEERSKLNPLLIDLQTQTKELQNQIAEDISQRYNKRVVNILGGCN